MSLEPIDIIVLLRQRGFKSLVDRNNAVRAVGPDVDKAEQWLRDRGIRPAAPCGPVVVNGYELNDEELRAYAVAAQRLASELKCSFDKFVEEHGAEPRVVRASSAHFHMMDYAFNSGIEWTKCVSVTTLHPTWMGMIILRDESMTEPEFMP